MGEPVELVVTVPGQVFHCITTSLVTATAASVPLVRLWTIRHLLAEVVAAVVAPQWPRLLVLAAVESLPRRLTTFVQPHLFPAASPAAATTAVAVALQEAGACRRERQGGRLAPPLPRLNTFIPRHHVQEGPISRPLAQRHLHLHLCLQRLLRLQEQQLHFQQEEERSVALDLHHLRTATRPAAPVPHTSPPPLPRRLRLESKQLQRLHHDRITTIITTIAN